MCDTVTNVGRGSWKQLRQTMAFLDKNTPRKRAPEIAGGGAATTVRTYGGSPTLTDEIRKRRAYTAQERTDGQCSTGGGRYSWTATIEESQNCTNNMHGLHVSQLSLGVERLAGVSPLHSKEGLVT